MVDCVEKRHRGLPLAACSRSGLGVSMSIDLDVLPDLASPAEISFTIEPAGKVKHLEQLWSDLEARADVTFYLTWDWIGHWLTEIGDARCYAVIGRLGATVVALALLTPASYRRHGLLKINSLFVHETGDPDIDVITIEYNGILADRSVTDAAVVGCLRFLQRPRWPPRSAGSGMRSISAARLNHSTNTPSKRDCGRGISRASRPGRSTSTRSASRENPISTT
jgi:hypothetical protein